MNSKAFEIRGTILAVTAAATFALLPASAAAMSAFAAGIPSDVATKGVALGESHNYSTRDDAEARALQECRSNKDASAEVQGLCRIIDHFDNRCLVTSLDPKAGTPGWGWAIGDTKDTTSASAIAMCRSTAGADREDYCVVTQSVCDGAAAK